MQNNAVTCWDIKKDLKRQNMGIVKQNNATLIYPVDLQVKIEIKSFLEVVFDPP
jgi:hypothetical protein